MTKDWHDWMHLRVCLTRPFLREPLQPWFRYSQALTGVSGAMIGLWVSTGVNLIPLALIPGPPPQYVWWLYGTTAAVSILHIVMQHRENKKLIANRLRERMENPTACRDSSAAVDWTNYTGVKQYQLGVSKNASSP